MWKTLIPVDGSDNALRAVQYAADSVKRHPQQEFVLLNVQHPFPLRAHASLSNEEIHNIAEDEAEKVLRPARTIMEQAGARYSVKAVSGDIDEVISNEVEESGCDAVVMGTRGMGAAANLVLGSVASKVLHLVKVPVTLVK
jgi:nucleotide-binding universal stress UspA family protein